MAEYSYENRNPRAVFKKDGVEDEREKAARILALCADKPIRRIRHSSDITPIKNPYLPVPDKRVTPATVEKRQKVVEALQAHGELPSPDLDELFGGREAARSILAGMHEAGVVDRGIVMQEINGKKRRVSMWRLA